jgi:ParB/RepB/Spo0J family partition protein
MMGQLHETQGASGIRVELIDPNPYVQRLEEDNISELASSIKRFGQLVPIKVRPHPSLAERYQAIFGYRRVLAAKTMGLSHVRAEVVNVDDEQTLLLALAENSERNNFTDYEIGLSLRQLRDNFGLSLEEISARIGKSVAYVSQHITMCSLFQSPNVDPNEARKVLQSLSERQARVLFRVRDPAERLHLAKVALTENLCLRELEKFVGYPRELTIANQSHVNWRESRAKTEQSLTKIINDMIEGMQRKDLRPLRNYRKENQFTLFDDFHPVSLFDYSTAINDTHGIIKRCEDFRISHDELKIRIFGGFAYATFFVTYTIRLSGKWFLIKSRVTAIFIRERDQWLVAHEHWSPISEDGVLDFRRIEAQYQR